LILDISLLRNPRFLDLHILPKRFEPLIEQALQFMKQNHFYEYEISKLQRALDYYRNETPNFEIREFQKDFAKFFIEADKRRGSSYQDYIPELSEYIQSWLNH